MALNDASRQELYQHYQDTGNLLIKVNALRERYTLYTVIVLSIMLLGVFGQIKSEDIITMVINKWLNSDVEFGVSYLRVILWFALLTTTLKYFNMNVQHEKLIKYLKTREVILNREYGEDLIIKEGKFYEMNYPAFSRLVWIIYTIIFPILLVLSVAVCLYAEIQTKESWNLVLILDCLLFTCIIISTSLYVLFLHSKNN